MNFIDGVTPGPGTCQGGSCWRPPRAARRGLRPSLSERAPSVSAGRGAAVPGAADDQPRREPALPELQAGLQRALPGAGAEAACVPGRPGPAQLPHLRPSAGATTETSPGPPGRRLGQRRGGPVDVGTDRVRDVTKLNGLACTIRIYFLKSSYVKDTIL